MRWAVICVLAGCYTKPEQVLAPHDGSPDGSVDAPPPVNCSAVPFTGSPMTLPEFGAVSPADPALSADGLEMYFTYNPDTSGMTYPYEIVRWTRSETDAVFAPDINTQPFNEQGVPDTDPSITADGSMIFFVSRRTGNDLAWFATRTPGSAWNTALPVPGLTMSVHSLDISADGLALYFFDQATPMRRLLMVSRSSLTADFGVPKVVGTDLGADVGYPTVSADQLELFFNDAGTQHATRATTDDPFTLAPPVYTSGGQDPDLSPDSETLVVAFGSTLAMLKRSCPAP